MEENELVIQLQNENGDNVDCTVVTTFEYNKRSYIALIPHEIDEEEGVDILLFRYKKIDQENNEGIQIENMSSDMEYSEVSSFFIEQIMAE